MVMTVIMGGLALGAIYALVALGLVVIYKGTGIVNFAHGAMFTAAAVIAYFLIQQVEWPYFLGLAGAVIGLIFIGLVVERIAFRPLIKTADPLIFKGATIAFAFLLTGVVRWVVAREGDYVVYPPILAGPPLSIFSISVPLQQLVILLAALITVGAFALFFMLTRYGRLMQAVAEDHDAARVIGINISGMYMWIWGAGALLGGVAGVLMGPITLVHPDLGLLIFIKAVAAAILGGFDNLAGAVIGGLILGLVEVFVSFYIGTYYQEVVGYLLILLVLMIRPRGLLGSPTVARV